MVGARIAATVLVSLAVWLSGCEGSPDQQRVLTTAYAGPMTLSLHAEISPKSAVVATVAHGDKLEVLGRRRRFVKVRTEKGVVGWTDTIRLLSATQKEALDQLADRARQMPSHGAATVFDLLNVHTEPNRQAPSFHQIKEGELVDVILYQTLPRVSFENPSLFPSRSRPVKPAKEKEAKKAPKIPPPPRPPAPKPPSDWVDLSRRRPPEPDPAVLPPPAPDPRKTEQAKVPQDDWALVRLPNGRAGWVLVRSLRMHIPDEVAQYSEGARITSYFAMAEYQDGDRLRHDWLWTTLSDTKQPWQFDGFRYFIWNTRRHRYETAYVQSGVRGYFPVETRKVDVASGRKREKFTGFVLIIEEDDGQKYRKTYAFQQYRVVLVSREPYASGEPAEPAPDQTEAPPSPTPSPKGDGWLAPIKKLKQKVFGS